MKPGDAIYKHEGKQCYFRDIPDGAEVVIFGIVQSDGSLKKHQQNLGRK